MVTAFPPRGTAGAEVRAVIDPPPATLRGALKLLNATSLRPMMDVLAVPTPKPTRKAEMVNVLVRRLTVRTLKDLWAQLDEKQQLAVAETLYGGDRRFDASRFRVKYGDLPQGIGEYGPVESPLLRCFLQSPDRSRSLSPSVPRDLAEKLRKFVAEPPDAVLESRAACPEATLREQPSGYGEEPTFEDMALVRRDMEQAAAQDLFAVLRLIDQGRLAVSTRTRRPSARTVGRIGEVLQGGDFFEASGKRRRRDEEAGPIRGFAWSWLVQAGGLAELAGGGKLLLTAQGRKALSAPPWETLRQVWRRWVKSNLFDEFSRMDEVKGQFRGRGRRALTSAPRRRAVVAEGIRECPPDRWVEVDELFRFMYATDLRFAVTRDPWTLYLVDQEYGSFGYANERGGDELELRYLLCVLFEYAATLGLVDVAFTDPSSARLDFTSRWGADYVSFLSRYDGLEFIRLNPLGAYCLGRARRYKPSTPPVRSNLTLFTDLRVRASSELPADERLLLETYARVEAEGVWRLDLDRALSALEGGHDAAELRTFLDARDEQPLPETVEAFLRRIERGASALTRRRQAFLVECANERVAEEITGNPGTARHCLRAGPRRLVVPAESEAKFRKAVHALGYALPLH